MDNLKLKKQTETSPKRWDHGLKAIAGISVKQYMNMARTISVTERVKSGKRRKLIVINETGSMQCLPQLVSSKSKSLSNQLIFQMNFGKYKILCG